MTDGQKFGSTNEQKKVFNKMKHDLEGWREVILLVNSILKWEKKFYPGIVFGATTILFLFLWYLDLSVLTLFCLIALQITILDFVFPMISKLIFKSENWTGDKEKQFENVCSEICSAKLNLCSWYHCIFASQEEKSPMIIISTSATLIFLAYLGAVVDNLLLSYFACLLAVFYPGLLQHGFVNIAVDKIKSCLSQHISCIKQKASDMKKSD